MRGASVLLVTLAALVVTAPASAMMSLSDPPPGAEDWHGTAIRSTRWWRSWR